MRTQPIPLGSGCYADDTRPWSQQDMANYLPSVAEVDGTRSVLMLKTPPGLRPFLEVPAVGTTPSPPVRRTHNCEGKLFAVIGQTLYLVNNVPELVSKGAIPGIGRVCSAHNQISLGNEALFVNGQAGYIYNTVTDTLARITDSGYPGSATAVFIDGFFIQIEPHGRFAFNSAAADGMSYNTLDRFTSEVKPDRLVAPAVFENKLLLLSTESGEYFENTGASQQPFRSTRIAIDKGCAGPYVVAHADNRVFYLGSDGMFYAIEGYRPVRISRRPIEQAILGLDWTQAFAEVWEEVGYTVIYWTFPNGHTWGYNTADKLWHRRESLGLDRWRVNSMTRWDDRWIAGDFQLGRLWVVDWDYTLEGDQEFVSEFTLPYVHDNQNLVLIPKLEVVMDVGQIETVPVGFPEPPPPPAPNFAFLANDNAANTWQISYGEIADDVYSNIATKTYAAYALTAAPYSQALFTYGGRLITVIPFDNEETAGGGGVIALRNVGTSTLEESHRFQYSGADFNTYQTLGRDGDTLYVFGEDNDSDIGVWALSYNAVDGFEQLGTPLAQNLATAMCMHGPYVILACDTGANVDLRAYSFDGSDFTLLDTSASVATAVGLEWIYSNGTTIWCQDGTSFEFDGANFTQITSGGDTDVIAATFDEDGNFIATDGDDLGVFDDEWNENVALALSPQHNGLVGIAFSEGMVYLPAGTGYDADRSGVYSWNGTDELARVADFILPTFTEPTACAIFKVDAI